MGCHFPHAGSTQPYSSPSRGPARNTDSIEDTHQQQVTRGNLQGCISNGTSAHAGQNFLSIDAHGNEVAVRQDEIGGPQIEKLLQRHGGRLERNRKYCGSCYGAEVMDDDCGNSCDEDRETYKKRGR